MARFQLLDTPLFNDPSLVAYYRLEADGTDSKSTNNLTLNGSPSFSPAEFGNGMDLGSSNSTKNATITSNLGITGGAITMAGWFNMNSQPGTNITYWLLAQVDNGSKVDYIMAYRDVGGTKSWYVDRARNGTADDLGSETITLSNGSWVHLALTYDGSNVMGYRNGSLVIGPVTSTGSGAVGATTRFDVGGEATVYTSALIDDVAVFNRALTPTEIANLYSGNMGPGIKSTNTIRPALFRPGNAR